MGNQLYPFLKTLHIVAIISWMAGLLYLYRLFVYHKDYGETSDQVHRLLSLMEIRLLRFITVPAMVVAVITGFSMAGIQTHYFHELWFQIKLVSILFLVLITLNGYLFIGRFKNFKAGPLSSVLLRVMNEIPTLLMIIAVAMVIFRPT